MKKLLLALGVKESQDKFLKRLVNENKDKKWTFNFIEIAVDKSGDLKHNAEKIGKGVESLEEDIDVIIAKETNPEAIDGHLTSLRILYEWMKGTRLKLTSPFDEMKSSFIGNEKTVEDLGKKLKQKRIDLLQKEFDNNKILIRDLLAYLRDGVSNDYGIIINMNSFEDFIEAKSKLKSFYPTKAKVLGAAATGQINDQFDLIANPLIKAKKLEEIKAKEQALLSKDLAKIAMDGDIDALENNLSALLLMIEEVDTFYENIKDSAIMQINNTKGNIKRQITVKEQEAAKKIEDDRINAIIDEYKKIDTSEMDIPGLSKLHYQMAEENIPELGGLVGDVYAKILELKNKALLDASKPNAEIEVSGGTYARQPVTMNNPTDGVGDTNPVSESTQKESMSKTYCLSESDINFLGALFVEAENEEIAKLEILNRVGAHLDMIDLEVQNG
jgi:hypothetical protein